MSLSPAVRLGAYEIIAAIGAGGMGQVYRARDTRLNRDVALKLLPELYAHDPDRLARFEREAQLLAALNHPNIAAIYGLEQAGATQFLVMELVDGESLADRLSRAAAEASRGKGVGSGFNRIGLPFDETMRIVRQVIDALDAAHEKGIIHRDLKPANIMLTVRDSPPPWRQSGRTPLGRTRSSSCSTSSTSCAASRPRP